MIIKVFFNNGEIDEYTAKEVLIYTGNTKMLIDDKDVVSLFNSNKITIIEEKGEK